MDRSIREVDDRNVSIFTKLRTAIADHGGRGEVRQALQQAQSRRIRVELAALGREDEQVLVATVEKVLDDAFIISQPLVGGTVRPLARFAGYTLTIGMGGYCLTGQTRALGRSRIRSAAGKELYGYRMELPEAFRKSERRQDLRVILGANTLREVRMRILDRQGAIHGLIEDLSAGGLSIRCRNARVDLDAGQIATVDLALPPPVGEINEVCTVIGTEVDPETGDLIAHLKFKEKIEEIEELVRRAARAGH